LEDNRVYYPETVALVDIEPSVLDRWKENVRFSDLLLAAALNLKCYKRSHIQDLAVWKQTTGALSPELRAMKELLISQGMDAARTEAAAQQAAQAGGNPWAAYDDELRPYRSTAGLRSWNDSRRTIEYIFVRDEPSTAAISLGQLVDEAVTRKDAASADRLREQQAIAEQLGIAKLHIVQALPILLAGIGFSRYFASPQTAADGDQRTDVKLRPFEGPGGKIPIYVARNTTEALLYELDPWRVTAFLQLNLGLNPPSDALRRESPLRDWLLALSHPLVERAESHLVLQPFEQEGGLTVDIASALLFGVLHTTSHVLKATAHRYVGIDGDALAEYLFPAHQAGLLYVSNHVEFTLGGIDSVFRSNMSQWLGSARDYASRCSFDPVCSNAGGACLACLYPKFGCAHFNRTVSRAFLFGGKVSGLENPLVGFWSAAVSEQTRQMRQSAQ
jgi:hypothetical protein